MKTKDSISKIKQDLHNQALFWDARAVQVLAEIALTSEEQEERSKKAGFCRQEAAKRRENLDKLQTRTWAQVRAGWK